MNETYTIIFAIIRSVFHGTAFDPPADADWPAVFTEMDKQKTATMAAGILGSLPLDGTLRSEWKKYLLSSRVFYEQLLHEQETVLSLLDGIPAAVIKGTASGVYYPDPCLRTMGDIDILISRGFHDRAVAALDGRYARKYARKSGSERRHTEFVRGNIEIELHKGMASEFVGADQDFFDGVLFDAMVRLADGRIGTSRFPMFPKTENGLILLRHMHQHLQEGIGLRHVTDWLAYMMDEEPVDWERFNEVSHRMGLFKFQCVITRLCEIYLGLERRPETGWCADAGDELCERLMEYIISRGNFGRAAETDASRFALKDIRGNIIKRLQLGGMCRWKAAQEHKVLRPFAWIYQGVRLSRKMLMRKHPVDAFKADMREAEKVRRLLDDLGLERQKAVPDKDYNSRTE